MVDEQKRVLGDSLMMIPDSEKRLAKALGELEELIVSVILLDLRSARKMYWETD